MRDACDTLRCRDKQNAWVREALGLLGEASQSERARRLHQNLVTAFQHAPEEQLPECQKALQDALANIRTALEAPDPNTPRPPPTDEPQTDGPHLPAP
jgi:hypothetical protein